MLKAASDWCCQPTALRIIDANDDEMSDDALDLEGIPRDARCATCCASLSWSALVAPLHAAEPAALTSLC